MSISDVTRWRLQQEDDFQEVYNKVRREAYTKAVSRLQHASQAAVATLLSVMADRTAPPACRARAADSILDRSHRGIELEDLGELLLDLSARHNVRQEIVMILQGR